MDTHTLASYRRKMRNIGYNLSRRKKRTERTGAEFYASRLRLYVPVKSGTLKRSIRRRGNTVRVGVTGNKGFPYVHWINQTHGRSMRTLNVKPKGKFGKTTVAIEGNIVNVPGGKMIYGSRPSSWNWTGRVKFATLAYNDAKKHFRTLAKRATKKAIIGETL